MVGVRCVGEVGLRGAAVGELGLEHWRLLLRGSRLQVALLIVSVPVTT